MSSLSNCVQCRFDLGPFQSKAWLALPTVNSDYVTDVLFSIRGGASGFGARCASNLSLSFAGVDITSATIETIKERLNAHPNAASEYQRAMTGWLSRAEVLGESFSVSLAADRRRAEQLSALKPADAIAALGDGSSGWGGNLHLFNFLFSEVTIPPLSMTQILKQGAMDMVLGDNLSQGFTISLPAHETSGEIPQGSVTISVEIVYENPVDAAIQGLVNAVGPGSPLEIAVLTLHDRFAAIADRVADADEIIGDTGDLASLSQAVRDIQKLLSRG